MKTNPQRNQDPLQSLLRSHPRPMWIFDHQTLQFLEVNPTAIQMYGYSRSEFLQMKITDIRPKEQVPKLLSEIRPFRMEGVHTSEWQHLTKDRRLMNVEVVSSQLYFHGRPAVFIEVHSLHDDRINIAFDDFVATSFQNILVQLKAAQDVMRHNPEQALRHIKSAELIARESLTRSQQAAEMNSSRMFVRKIGNRSRQLTLREKEVLHLLTAGKSNKEIAATLHVTEGTIKLHVNHILRKLGTTARTETAMLAVKSGIVRI